MTGTPEEQSLQLVQQLYVRTREGKVRWEPASGTRIRAEFAPYFIEMYTAKDPEFPDAPDYFVEVQDDMDRAVETISNYTFQPFMDLKYEDMNPYQLLSRLYLNARRNALGADKALGIILKKLAEG